MSRTDLKEQTWEIILIAAAACLAENGCSDCFVSNIMDKEGFSKAMIEKGQLKGMERAGKAFAQAPYLNGIIWFMKKCVQNG